MTTKKLQLTEFYIEKLKTVVNVGGSSAYQILTTQGTILGHVGTVPTVKAANASNDSSFEEVTAASINRQSSRSRIRMTLSALFAR